MTTSAMVTCTRGRITDINTILVYWWWIYNLFVEAEKTWERRVLTVLFNGPPMNNDNFAKIGIKLNDFFFSLYYNFIIDIYNVLLVNGRIKGPILTISNFWNQTTRNIIFIKSIELPRIARKKNNLRFWLPLWYLQTRPILNKGFVAAIFWYLD